MKAKTVKRIVSKAEALKVLKQLEQIILETKWPAKNANNDNIPGGNNV